MNQERTRRGMAHKLPRLPLHPTPPSLLPPDRISYIFTRGAPRPHNPPHALSLPDPPPNSPFPVSPPPSPPSPHARGSPLCPRAGTAGRSLPPPSPSLLRPRAPPPARRRRRAGCAGRHLTAPL
eukprot:scaffold32209_cov28-Tisochrysis_lutea.AAC.1